MSFLKKGRKVKKTKKRVKTPNKNTVTLHRTGNNGEEMVL